MSTLDANIDPNYENQDNCNSVLTTELGEDWQQFESLFVNDYYDDLNVDAFDANHIVHDTLDYVVGDDLNEPFLPCLSDKLIEDKEGISNEEQHASPQSYISPFSNVHVKEEKVSDADEKSSSLDEGGLSPAIHKDESVRKNTKAKSKTSSGQKRGRKSASKAHSSDQKKKKKKACIGTVVTETIFNGSIADIVKTRKRGAQGSSVFNDHDILLDMKTVTPDVPAADIINMNSAFGANSEVRYELPKIKLQIKPQLKIKTVDGQSSSHFEPQYTNLNTNTSYSTETNSIAQLTSDPKKQKSDSQKLKKTKKSVKSSGNHNSGDLFKSVSKSSGDLRENENFQIPVGQRSSATNLLCDTSLNIEDCTSTFKLTEEVKQKVQKLYSPVVEVVDIQNISSQCQEIKSSPAPAKKKLKGIEEYKAHKAKRRKENADSSMYTPFTNSSASSSPKNALPSEVNCVSAIKSDCSSPSWPNLACVSTHSSPLRFDFGGLTPSPNSQVISDTNVPNVHSPANPDIYERERFEDCKPFDQNTFLAQANIHNGTHSPDSESTDHQSKILPTTSSWSIMKISVDRSPSSEGEHVEKFAAHESDLTEQLGSSILGTVGSPNSFLSINKLVNGCGPNSSNLLISAKQKMSASNDLAPRDITATSVSAAIGSTESCAASRTTESSPIIGKASPETSYPQIPENPNSVAFLAHTQVKEPSASEENCASSSKVVPIQFQVLPNQSREGRNEKCDISLSSSNSKSLSTTESGYDSEKNGAKPKRFSRVSVSSNSSGSSSDYSKYSYGRKHLRSSRSPSHDRALPYRRRRRSGSFSDKERSRRNRSPYRKNRSRSPLSSSRFSKRHQQSDSRYRKSPSKSSDDDDSDYERGRPVRYARDSESPDSRSERRYPPDSKYSFKRSHPSRSPSNSSRSSSGSSYSRNSRSPQRRKPRSHRHSRKTRRRSKSGSRNRSYSPRRNVHSSSSRSSYTSTKRSWEEQQRQIDERRVVYVGLIPDGFTTAQLRARFACFGAIEDVRIYIRETRRNDNYGFVTFHDKSDAYKAVEFGNYSSLKPEFEISFGGRRRFCNQRYSDLDKENEANEKKYYLPPPAPQGEDDFDALLKAEQKRIKSQRRNN